MGGKGEGTATPQDGWGMARHGGGGGAWYAPYLERHAALAAVVPGASACADARRKQHSADFLWCEGGMFLPSHFVNPMLACMLSGDPQLTLFGMLFSEAVEHAIVTFYPDAFAFLLRGENSETIAALFVGDVLLVGAAGSLAGYAILQAYALPPLASSPARAREVHHVGRQRVYVVAYALLNLTTMWLPLWTVGAGEARVGVALYGALVVAFLWGGLYWRFSRLKVDDELLWTRRNGELVPRGERAGALALASGVVVAVVAPHVVGTPAQPLWGGNEWVQLASVAGPCLAGVVAVACARVAARGDVGVLLRLLAGVAYVGGTVLLVGHAEGAWRDVGLGVTGTLALALAAALFLFAEVAWGPEAP